MTDDPHTQININREETLTRGGGGGSVMWLCQSCGSVCPWSHYTINFRGFLINSAEIFSRDQLVTTRNSSLSESQGFYEIIIFFLFLPDSQIRQWGVWWRRELPTVPGLWHRAGGREGRSVRGGLHPVLPSGEKVSTPPLSLCRPCVCDHESLHPCWNMFCPCAVLLFDVVGKILCFC